MVQLENPLRFGHDLWDPSHRFETSWLLPPYILGGIRASIGLYALFVLLFQVGWYCTHTTDYGGCAQAGDEFSYFTILTYWGIAFYHLTAAAHTFSYARTGTPFLERLPRALQALHAFYYTTVTTYPFLVTAVYWGVIYPGVWFAAEFDAWSNTSEHALNSAFALFEIVVPRTPAPLWIHAWWLVLVLALYLALAYTTYYTKGFYTYSFLDIQTQGSTKTAVYIIVIAVGSVLVFSLIKGAIHLRLWVTERKLGLEGKFAGAPSEALSSRGHDGLGLEHDGGRHHMDVEMGRVHGGKSESPVSTAGPHHL